MNSLLAQLWVPAVALLLGLGIGWLGRRLLAKTELREVIDRLLLVENELRSARAALIRERQLRLGAQTALRHAEVDRASWAAPAHEHAGPGSVRTLEEMGASAIAADEMVTGELEELMVEVVEGPRLDLPEPESTHFNPFGGGAYSEPPPRVSDVRALRRTRSNDEITRRAYELWDAAGRPSGEDLHFWCQAEEELRHEPLRVATGE